MVSVTAQSSVAIATERRQEARTRYWVMPGLQVRMILWMVLVTATMATIAAWAILLAVWSPLGDRLVMTGNGIAAQALYQEACLRVLLTTGLLIAVFGAIAFVVALSVSHKVAGPLHRLSQVARNVARGRVRERVALRRGDYLHRFAAAFNEMLERVEDCAQRRKRLLARVDTALSDLERSSAEGRLTPDALNESLRDMLQCLRDGRWAEESSEAPAV